MYVTLLAGAVNNLFDFTQFRINFPQNWALTPAALEPVNHSIGLSKEELEKLQEIQLLDRFHPNGSEQPHWDVEQVLSHKASRTVKHIPGQLRQRVYLKKEVRVKVQFATGQTAWLPMRAVHNQDVTPLLIYAKQYRLQSHPNWQWTRHYEDESLHSWIVALKTKLERTPKFKFGIQVPRSIKHALQLDAINGNHLWRDSIETEMSQLADYNTFRLPTDRDNLDDYQTIPYHMVFDVKYDGRRKCRLVSQGDKVLVPTEDVYSGVVGIETIRLAMVLASTKGLQVCAADVGNAFLYADNKEKTKIIAGPEFGALEGQTLIVRGGWYDHKTAAAGFHAHLSATLRLMGFRPSRTDMDLWYRERGVPMSI
jgi:hypothetical protein